MLQRRTVVRVADNTGVVTARIMQIYNGSKTYARLGDFVRVVTRTIKRILKVKKVKAKRKRKILFRKRRRMVTIVRVRRAQTYHDGTTIAFRDNSVIFYKKKRTFKGKRFHGITTRLLGFRKILHKFKFYI